MFSQPPFGLLQQRRTWRNRLAFPTGRAPGFDPNHPASFGIGPGTAFVSFVSTPKGVYCPHINKAVSVLTGSASAMAMTNFGPAMTTLNGTSAVGLSGLPTVTPTALTIAFIGITTSGSGSQMPIEESSITAGPYYNGGATPNMELWYSGVSNYTATLTLTTGIPYFFVMTQTASGGSTVWVNLLTGQIFTNTSAGTGAFGTWGSSVAFGSRTTGLYPWTGYLHASMASKAPLSLKQQLEWAANPWQFWYPKPADFFLLTKGLSAYSLVGTTASYALTAATLTAKTARKQTLNSTSYAETASTLTFKRGLPLTSATYAETPSSLTAKTARALPLTTASYAETASTATAKTARLLTGTSSSYAETPSSITIKRGLTLTSASYAETPSTLTAKTARRLTGTTASYAGTASSLTPQVARKILGTSATYALTDAAATAKAARFLQGLSTSYALSDSTATLIVSSGAAIVGTSAIYSLTPSTATLKHAAKLAMSSSAYALTASAANLIYSPGGVPPAGVADWITLARRRGRR